MDLNAYDLLSAYTLSKNDVEFIHQHIVDAHTAQIADTSTHSMTLVFALAGLYLYVECEFTGKQVQQFHQTMARYKSNNWPTLRIPHHTGNITAQDVLNVQAGIERDMYIRNWCQSVWDAHAINQDCIRKLVELFL